MGRGAKTTMKATTEKSLMKPSQLSRIIGFTGIAVAAILLVGLTGTDWFFATMLAFIASLILVANTR